jgi:hypothetical protein
LNYVQYCFLIPPSREYDFCQERTVTIMKSSLPTVNCICRDRVARVLSRLESLQALTDGVIAQSLAQIRADYAANPNAHNPMPVIESRDEELLGNADLYVADLIAATNPTPTLTDFGSIIPNLYGLKIADPSQLERQYREEMTRPLRGLQAKASEKAARKGMTKAARKRRPMKSNDPDAFSRAVANTYIGPIPQSATIIRPPPVGQTTGWPTYAPPSAARHAASPRQQRAADQPFPSQPLCAASAGVCSTAFSGAAVRGGAASTANACSIRASIPGAITDSRANARVFGEWATTAAESGAARIAASGRSAATRSLAPSSTPAPVTSAFAVAKGKW